MNILKWLEKSGSTKILLTLVEYEKLTITQLQKRSGVVSNTLYDRLKELEKKKLINREERAIEEPDYIFRRVVFISLTPKGKKVAEKLMEIKRIMEEE